MGHDLWKQVNVIAYSTTTTNYQPKNEASENDVSLLLIVVVFFVAYMSQLPNPLKLTQHNIIAPEKGCLGNDPVLLGNPMF